MDLSNLSSNLPLSKPVNQTSLNEVTQELTIEFKHAAKAVATLYNSATSSTTTSNTTTTPPPTKQLKSEFATAARSVAALYKITHNSTSLFQSHGYLQCLDDLLQIIATDGDVENWALTRRAEITNTNNSSNNTTSSQSSDPIETTDISPRTPAVEESIPQDFEFSILSDIKPPVKFIPTVPPISVQHTNKQRQHHTHNRKQKLERIQRKLVEELRDGSGSDYESDTNERSKLRLRKEATGGGESPIKKKQKLNESDI
ncbi:uncharacterized protein J8A68_003818 [[Candida] subhashii]|uniref:Uncharacterized protein n=1 Tax=[Candida] subhashii TaxID=561895 RepID=A0A8J5UGT2_9ASCO|nr:uncharacterized protein J8A68_003818 [[Candida] subhashii]KAG7662688.1 hypothetical protein J8A68_003818 [[Candida] subhashii]